MYKSCQNLCCASKCNRCELQHTRNVTILFPTTDVMQNTCRYYDTYGILLPVRSAVCLSVMCECCMELSGHEIQQIL